MDTSLATVIAVGVLIAALVAYLLVRLVRHRLRLRQRETELREAFGPLFDRLVQEKGRSRAIDELEARRKRLEVVDLTTVGPTGRKEFSERWHEIQHAFVDAPADAVRRADVLVTEVMRSRNFPVGTVEERWNSIALHGGDEGGEVAEELRRAHELFVAVERDATTDLTTADFRDALLGYRAAFELVLARPASDDDRVDTRPVEAVRHP